MNSPDRAPRAQDHAPSAGDSLPRLRCLHGAALPEDLARDARRLDKLSDGALSAIGAMLVPCVLEPMSPELARELSKLCLRHEVAEADVGRVLRVVRALLQESAASDSDRASFEADAHAVWPELRTLSDALFANFELVKRELRKRLLEDALQKHGNVLVDVDWRVDYVASERHAAKLMLPLALVTLHYRDAAASNRLTIQLLPEQLRRLEQVFGALAQRTLRPLPEPPTEG